MEIKRAGSRPSGQGQPEYFTGRVRFDPVGEAQPPGRVRAIVVTFEPGARTAWHTHPYGQTLFVLSGCGRVQLLGGPVQEIRPGDTVSIAAGEKHWHGAGPETAMSHMAIQEAQDGKTADWMEHVTDEEYGAA